MICLIVSILLCTLLCVLLVFQIYGLWFVINFRKFWSLHLQIFFLFSFLAGTPITCVWSYFLPHNPVIFIFFIFSFWISVWLISIHLRSSTFIIFLGCVESTKEPVENILHLLSNYSVFDFQNFNLILSLVSISAEITHLILHLVYLSR